MVTKPGKVRICLDCRKVNSFTEKDAYPLPQISGILSRLPKAEYISSLDLKDAYWQVPLDVASRDKTAFTVPGRPLYQFKVMPFGLCNATSTMSRLMDKVVPAHLRNEVFIYLDDLLVISASFERHLEVLREVALHIRHAGLTINIGKSHFCMLRVRYLGHIIGDGGIRTDPEKVAAITNFPLPRSLRSLRSFMGLCGWYRKFVPNFAAQSAPLTDLMTTKRKFSLTDEAIKAFEQLKRCLTRWALALQRYNFDIEHRKGSLNIVPDSLSRVNEDTVAALDLREGLLVDLNSEHFKSSDYVDLVEKVEANQANFPDLKTDSGYVYRKAEHLTGEQVHDEYAWKLWIPRELVPEILSRAHDSPLSSHGGIHKTIERAVRKIDSGVVIKYLEGELFMAYGAPETVVSDNGSQFRSHAFQKLMQQYGVTHTLTAVHSPQANASERVNRSVISAIRAYLRPDQKDWDEYLSRICCALRSSVHASIGTSPYYMVFGQHMITSGSAYSLLRKLNLLDDRSLKFNREDSFDIVRDKASKRMQEKHDENEKRYNLRSRIVSFAEGQEVFRRNFKQSCFQTGYNAKFGPSFVKARVRKKLGSAYYELEDLQGRLLGTYHAKDIRQ
nr:uncharacterized protein LOC123002541 [Drosophila takahashii]